MQSLLNIKGKRTAMSLALVLVLSGCSEGENKTESEQQQDPGEAKSAMSRLVVTEQNSNSIYVLDGGKDWDLMAQFSLQNAASGLKTSPNGRYALAMQRNQNLVEIIDSGLEAEAHGDHFHLHAEAPQLLTSQYQGIKPTHYDLGQNVAAIFFDGNAGSGENAEFRLVKESTIANAEAVATYRFNYAVHGTAQVLGEHVFTGIVENAANPALPNKVLQTHLHGDHFHDVALLPEECPALHGSAQSKTQLAFGCSDGVVHIQIQDGNVTSTKLVNPSALAEGSRFGSILGYYEADTLLAYASASQQLFQIQAGQLKEVKWQQTENEKAQFISQSSDYLAILSTASTLHLLSAENNFSLYKSISLWNELPSLADKPNFALAEDKRTGHLIVTDPINNQLIEVNPVTAEVTKHNLSFAPNLMTWVGTVEQEHQH